MSALLRFAAAAPFAAALLHAQGMAVGSREARASPLTEGAGPPPAVAFRDIAREAGLNFRHVAGSPEKNYILEVMGSGLALLDYNGDGLLDVFLVNQTAWHVGAGNAPSSRLFRNDGGLRFTDVTAEAGLMQTGWGQAACAADYDNDGYTDLFVSNWGENKLFHNRGDGVFEDVSKQAGLSPDSRRWDTGCAFLDYDRDGLLDLAVASYVDFDPAKTPKRGENELCRYHGKPVLCGPRGLPGGTNRLFHNKGDGRFRDVSEASGFSRVAGRYGLGVLADDFDGDGLTDVYIACDSTPSILFRNNGDGTFRDIGLEAGVALNENGREQGGMGIAAGDFGGDGRTDLVKTNFADDLPSLYRNEGDGFFSDTAYRGGLGVNIDRVGWGVGFLDFDLDGFQDLLIVNGHVYPEADAFRQSALLYWNLGNGAFLDVSAKAGPAIGERRVSRGAAFGDLDNDGRIEAVINNLDGAPTLLRQTNEPSGHWLTLRLEGVESNRDAIGARVEIVAGDALRTASVRSGGSYLSDNDRRLHFGLGTAETAAEVRILWPGGRHESFGPLTADRIHTLREGDGPAKKVIDH